MDYARCVEELESPRRRFDQYNNVLEGHDRLVPEDAREI
jgi:hypothetical protein